MLNRAGDDVSASQGGYTEDYPKKNDNGQYQHNNIVTFINAIRRVLKTSYNMSNPCNGMLKLIDSSTGVPLIAIFTINSNDVATIATTLTTDTHEAAAITAALGPGAARITPTITTSTEDQYEANRLNLNCQAVIGAQEGATTAITYKVGSDVTNIVLRTVNGYDFKGIDDYELQK